MDTINSPIHAESADRQSAIRSEFLLDDLLFDTAGLPMSPTCTCRKGRLYCHYVSKSKAAAGEVRRVQQRVSACEIEAVVVRRVKSELIRQQAIVIAGGLLLKLYGEPLTEDEIATKFVCGRLADSWDQLSPAERIRIVKLLIERIVLCPNGLEVKWRNMERREFAKELTKLVIFEQLSNKQPDPDVEIDPPVSFVLLPPGFWSRGATSLGKPV